MNELIKKNKTLFEVAESQQGLFTAKQAEECGFIRSNHTYHVKSGQWIREHRGIYRLAMFPNSREEQLVMYSLWSQNREGDVQGVFSHETALSHYELSDLNPSKLHMTVPNTFRRNSEIPKVLVLHFAEIAPNEIQLSRGFRVTKPLRTLQDAISCKRISPEFVSQAISEALNKGLIRRSQLKVLLETAKEANFFIKELEHLVMEKAA
jgi:predicted transcriptional regulator of viral defense system